MAPRTGCSRSSPRCEGRCRTRSSRPARASSAIIAAQKVGGVQTNDPLGVHAKDGVRDSGPLPPNASPQSSDTRLMLATLFGAATAAPVDGQQHVEIVLAKYNEGVEWANKYKDKATVTVRTRNRPRRRQQPESHPSPLRTRRSTTSRQAQSRAPSPCRTSGASRTPTCTTSSPATTRWPTGPSSRRRVSRASATRATARAADISTRVSPSTTT